jgi:hypothetical protein
LQEVFAGEALVVINMDETAVRHEYNSKAGNVIGLGRRVCSRARWCEERIAVSETRAHCTLVAFVTNHAPLQQHLPQIFLPSSAKRPLTAAEDAKFTSLAAPMETWRGTGGWITAEIMMRLLTRIRQAVRAQMGMVKILLWLDAATQHVSVDVLNHAARLQIYMLLVPASLTWLMQPLDVYVFSKFKGLLRELQRTGRKNAPDAKLPPNEWITLTGEAVQRLLVHTDWSHAFGKLGMGPAGHILNQRLAPYMLPAAELVPGPPTDADAVMLLGRHRVDVAKHFVNGPNLLLTRRAEAALAAAAGAAAHPEAAAAAALAPAGPHEVPPALRLRRLPSLRVPPEVHVRPPPLPPPHAL